MAIDGRVLSRFWFWMSLCLVFILHSPLPAQEQLFQRVEIASSPSPVGSGARAVGRGGAFIAVADDATAASWNPGGLFQLDRKELSIVGAAFHRVEDHRFGAEPDASGPQSVSDADMNYLSAAYPFSLFNRRMILSLSYQNLYNFNRDMSFSLDQTTQNITARQTVDYEQDGDLYALGLSWGVQILYGLGVGVTVNFWDDDLFENQWDQRYVQTFDGAVAGAPFTGRAVSRESYSFSGVNANIGFLYHVFDDNLSGEKLTVGGVVKLPFRADLKHSISYDGSIVFSDFPDNPIDNQFDRNMDEKLEMPLSYGVGVAYRFSGGFKLSLDISRTEWDEYVLIDADGNETSPLTGLPAGDSDVRSTTHARIGGEYHFSSAALTPTICAGLFYDPAPSEGNPDDIYGFSLGGGVQLFGNVKLDAAYQFRWGNDVGAYALKNLDYSQNLEEHAVYLSVIYSFGEYAKDK